MGFLSSRKDDLSKAFWDDKEAQQLMKRYYKILEKVENGYRELSKNKDFSGKQATQLITSCKQGIKLFEQLVPIWNSYEEPIPHLPLYIRLAMIYERKNDYKKAALVCVEAIQKGYLNDGTKGGMHARLKRMIKKGKLDLTPEMASILS